MKINSTFHLTLLIGALVILAAVFSFGYLQLQITEAVQQKETLDRISNEGMELVQLTNEVLIQAGPRAIQQWQAHFERVSAIVGDANIESMRARDLVERSAAVLADMPPLMDRTVSERVVVPETSKVADPVDLLESQFFRKTVQLQTLLREVIKYSEAELQNSVARTKELMLLAFAVFTAVISILALIASYLFRKTILQPIQHLDEVIDELNTGDQGRRARVFNDDEIGVVCETFNRLLDQQEAHRRELQVVADLLRATFDQAAVGIAHIGLDGNCRLANRRLCEIFGVAAAELVGRNLEGLALPEFRDSDLASRQALLAGEIDTYTLEKRYIRTDQRTVWINLTVSLVRDADGVAQYFIQVFEDISSRKAAEQRVEFLAYHDVLTGLPNQLLAQDRLLHAVAYADRSRGKLAFLFLDLDNFKTINDSLGHQVGDGLLKAVAERLLGCVRDTDTVSRKGGDEFIIVLTEIWHADDVVSVADKMLSRLAAPFHIDGHELTTSVSIGIALYPDDSESFDTLLTKADTAMYQAKAAGRNAYRFFTEQMNLDASEYLRVRNGLHRALEQNEFVLHYQPQIDLTTRAVTGAEALIRWQHPELGMVPPNRFIPVAEDSGLILPIGEWVIREACRQMAAWCAAGLPPMLVAVNLSAVQFKRGDLENTVLRALNEFRIAPGMLELELTESILIHDTDSVLTTVQRLKTLGVKLSIDDFGTGYSSLAYLRRFNVDKLKIDQSFVRELAKDAEDAAIVQAVIRLAQGLNLRTIAEGVEDAATAAELHRQGCEEAQGYHFARPMPAAEFAVFLGASSSPPPGR